MTLSIGNKETHIYGVNIEQVALDQFEDSMKQPFSVKGALMADGHPGYTLPIGGVIATDGFILPSWVGFDEGCGVAALLTTFTLADVQENAEKIFHSILRSVPIGMRHNANPVPWDIPEDLRLSVAGLDIFTKRKALWQLGTMGGNNHFIEIGVDELSRIWIIVHCGSRGFGKDVAGYWMCIAADSDKPKEGHFGFHEDTPKGKLFIQDLNFCLYAVNDDGCPSDQAMTSGRGGWQEDAHTDKLHNVLDAMNAFPEWAK